MTSRAASRTTARASSGFSSPLPIQTTKGGAAAVSAPASTVSVTGLRDTRTATRWKAQKIPAAQTSPSELGEGHQVRDPEPGAVVEQAQPASDDEHREPSGVGPALRDRVPGLEHRAEPVAIERA